MSEHAWSLEHVAAFVAGGLTAAERERLEAHARDCAECAAAVAAARGLDRGLGELFAGVRPDPALEDRVVRSLRTVRRPLVAGWRRNLAVGVAASVGLGAIGAGVSLLAGPDGPPLPGMPWSDFGTSRRITRESVSVSTVDGGDDLHARAYWRDEPAGDRPKGVTYLGTEDLTNPDRGLDPNVMAAIPADKLDNNAATDQSAKLAPSFKLKRPEPHSPSANYWFEPSGAKPAVVASLGKDTKANAFHPPVLGTGVTPPQSGYSMDGSVHSTNGPFLNLNTWGAIPNPDGTVTGTPSAPAQPPAQAPKPAAPAAADPEQAVRRVVLRSGEVEFEVDSFDSAVATITKLVGGIKGAYVATVNSDKLPNGKVKGSVAVRVPPEHLDSLVLDLRKELGKGGELKGQKIGSQDVTKQYTDLESRLKAARTMEQRLLQIIKEGKGEIKQLLDAEKELGTWRTRIEEIEGELRYYANLAALSTLTINLAEKDIRAAAGVVESERVQAGVEVEDVEQAYRQLLDAVTQAKGHVTKSELKQLSAGQFNAALQFEVAPEAAGPVRDRLRQLGRVARLEIDRVQQAEGGTTPKDGKVRRGDTLFLVQLYNLANVAPRETATVQVAVTDVPAAYQAVRDAVGKAHGRVVTAQVSEQDRQNVTAQLDFEVRRADEGALTQALAAAGEVVSRQVTRAPESENVTDTKVLYKVTLLPAARLKPREQTTLGVEVADVEATAALFTSYVEAAKGRQVDAKVDHEANGRVTAHLLYEVPLAAAGGVVERFKSAGTVRVQQSSRNPQAPEGRFATARIDVTLTNSEAIVAQDEGLSRRVRGGLSYSASVLLASVTWVVFGLCVVLPWAVVGYVAYRVVRWLFRPAREASPPAAPAG